MKCKSCEWNSPNVSAIAYCPICGNDKVIHIKKNKL
jgi:hypothetical protein